MIIRILFILFFSVNCLASCFASSYTPISEITPRSRATSASINDLNNNVAAAFNLLPDEDALARGTVTSAIDTGVANAYVVSLPTAPSGYVDNLQVVMLPLNTNTGASTINVNALGVVAIKHQNGTDALDAGDIVVGVPVEMRYSTVTGAFHINQNSATSAASASASAAASAISAAESAASAAAALVSENAAADDAALVSVLSDKYYPDYSKADQGEVFSSDTIYYHTIVHGIVTKVNIVLRHNYTGTTTVYNVLTDLEIPSNVTLKIEPGAILDGTGKLTFAKGSHLIVGDTRAFATGFVVEFEENVISELPASAWGVTGDDSTDNETDLTAALLACPGIKLKLNKGIYRINDEVVLNAGNIIIGAGFNQTYIDYWGSGKALKLEGTGSNLFGLKIEGITLRNRATGTIALSLKDVNFASIKWCSFTGSTSTPWLTAVIKVDGSAGGVGSYNNSFEDCAIEYGTIGFLGVNEVVTEQHISRGRIYECALGVSVAKGTLKLNEINFSNLSTTYDSTYDGVGVSVTDGGIVVSHGSRFESMGTAYSHDGSGTETEIISNGDTISAGSITKFYWDTNLSAEGYAGVSGIGRGKGGNQGNRGKGIWLTNTTLAADYKFEATSTLKRAVALSNYTNYSPNHMMSFNTSGSIVGLYNNDTTYANSTLPSNFLGARGQKTVRTTQTQGESEGFILVEKGVTTVNETSGEWSSGDTNITVSANPTSSGHTIVATDRIGIKTDGDEEFWWTTVSDADGVDLTLTSASTANAFTATNGTTVVIAGVNEYGQIGYRTAASSPVSAYTPYHAREEFWDSNGSVWYKATGESNWTEWKAIQ